jgi:uncharacterized protein (TIGR02246 family)
VGVDLAAESGIRRTLARYCQRCDDGDFAAWAQLFEADATFSVLGETHEGRDTIRAFIEAAQPEEARGKHVIAQSDIDVYESGDEATAVTDYVFVSRALRITSAGRYHDRLRLGDDGEWRFVSREIRFL